MNVFGKYARYYDLLYRDKDYIGEAQFIHRLIQTHSPNAKSILELGCGTGTHAVLLAKEGYSLHGVDLSDEMLQKANERRSQLSPDLSSRLKFSHGNICDIRINESFDVVLSLFHVISYQTTNLDLQSAFSTVKQHLKPGGIFIFDIWYGPAVLTERPVVRIKRIEDTAIRVTRIAEPKIYPNENRVDVNYHVFVQDKSNQSVDEIQETHHIRYLFQPEIELLLNQFGMKIVEVKEWMTNQDVSSDTWSVYFLVQLQ